MMIRHDPCSQEHRPNARLTTRFYNIIININNISILIIINIKYGRGPPLAGYSSPADHIWVACGFYKTYVLILLLLLLSL